MIWSIYQGATPRINGEARRLDVLLNKRIHPIQLIVNGWNFFKLLHGLQAK